MIDPYYTEVGPVEIPAAQLDNINLVNDRELDYTVSFIKDDKTIGKLDFKTLPMTFTGDADESAKLFFDKVISFSNGFVKASKVKELLMVYMHEGLVDFIIKDLCQN